MHFPELDKLEAQCQTLYKILKNHGEQYGGHFAGSLGVLELTLTLHHLFQFPKDKLIWDVGHQAYAHKWLTGRKEGWSAMRRYGGLHPFPSPLESLADPCVVGHAGNALGVGIGLATAFHAQGSQAKVVVVTGDASFESGVNLEAVNQLSHLNPELNLLWILNCNGHSIDPLPHPRLFLKNWQQAQPDPCSSLFGRIVHEGQGNHLPSLLKTLKPLSQSPGLQVLVLQTQKGHRHAEATQEPAKFHAYPPTTAPKKLPLTFPQRVGAWAPKAAAQNPKLHFISPAMLRGSQLQALQATSPQRVTDVGIAESYGLTLAAGLAAGGQQPVAVYYSTFLQRGYDQLIHDIALAQWPVTLLIDRAGCVGGDGATHQGIYDAAFLGTIPHFHLWTPSHDVPFKAILQAVEKGIQAPTAIRYPNRSALLAPQLIQPFQCTPIHFWSSAAFDFALPGTLYQSRPRSHRIFFNFGACLSQTLEAAAHLKADVLDCPVAQPLPMSALIQVGKAFSHWITVEEGIIHSGIGSRLLSYLQSAPRSKHRPKHFLEVGIPHSFLPHGSVQEQWAMAKLDAQGIVQQVLQWESQLKI